MNQSWHWIGVFCCKEMTCLKYFGRSFSKTVPVCKPIVSELQNGVRSFFHDKASEEHLSKSIAGFEKAKEYFQSNIFVEAKATISEAIEDALEVNSITPNSFALKLMKFEEKITETMDNTSHGTNKRSFKQTK